MLDEIEKLDKELKEHFKKMFSIEPSFTRALVSFQANKERPVYRWYKFKEAFSAALVETLLSKTGISRGVILDPFAGSGTSLFTASEMGIDSEGIELLPIGQQLIETKTTLDSEFKPEDLQTLIQWKDFKPWKSSNHKGIVPELRITKGAYSKETKEAIEKYIGAYQNVNKQTKAVLNFALLSTLEIISYTRKDGQYLRWDYRSGRKQGKKKFDKGRIFDFDSAIQEKLSQIITDLSPSQNVLFPIKSERKGKIVLHKGSCLSILPKLNENTFDALITSPPYCNRYDYTRTYALELSLLGIGERELSDLRQDMLSCTVENRGKDLLNLNAGWSEAVRAADEQSLLQIILKYLDNSKEAGLLNNNGIPRMVRGYFYEMACVILESYRVLKPGAPFIMVNDNVRYSGASISVDLILSAFAEKLGFKVENICVLPNGKGNSSQQMGKHGRDPLRKCIYIWRKK